MKLSRNIRILIGLLTAWVTFYPLVFIAVWLLMVISMFGLSAASSDSVGFPPFMALFFAIFPLHCLTMMLSFGLLVFYLIHIIKNVTASETARIVLGVGIFMAGFIAMPIYYYLYIWSDNPPAWALQSPPSTPAKIS